MTLTNIEYGSLASSDIMNKNFSYLDTKITETTNDITTMISSILSNIATLNSKLGDLSDEISNSNSELEVKIETYKTKTKELVSKSTLIPNWKKTVTLSDLNSYTAPSNGYVLILPTPSAEGNLTINGMSVSLKNRSVADDNASELMVIPVQADDVVTSTVALTKAYFVPSADISVEDF
jgi:hypothetical protein